MSVFAESHVEEAALAWLEELGYSVCNGLVIGPEGSVPERASYGDVILAGRVKAAIARLNPHLKADTREDVLRKILQSETPSLTEENRRLHRYLIEGVPVEVTRADGTIGGDSARLLDFDDLGANDWLAVNQFIVIENKANRRPDIVLFINGLPLGVIELKNPGDENATMDGAFNQLQTYKSQITSTFRTNAALVISDGMAARIGSLTADRERFMPWRTLDGDGPAPKGVPELETLLRGASGVGDESLNRDKRYLVESKAALSRHARGCRRRCGRRRSSWPGKTVCILPRTRYSWTTCSRRSGQ